jgi:hypothetical protein
MNASSAIAFVSAMRGRALGHVLLVGLRDRVVLLAAAQDERRSNGAEQGPFQVS